MSKTPLFSLKQRDFDWKGMCVRFVHKQFDI